MAKVIVDLGVAGLTIGDILWVGCERVRDYVVVPTLDSTLTYIPDSVGSYWLENPNVTENSLFYICKNLTTITPVGQSWAQQVNPKNINLSSVCWSGTQFVAVGDHDSGDAYILTSPDGITWTERVNPKALKLNFVCWSGTQFVAVGEPDTDAYILTSPDGITWTERANPQSIRLNFVCWSGTQFVAVGGNSTSACYILTSPNGITWTNRTSPAAYMLNSVCWSGTQFVAVGFAEPTKALILTSPDGVTWTERANPKACSLNSVCWSGTQFVAVGDPDSGDAYILTSPDGVTWTERANPKNIQSRSVCWSGTQFVAVGAVDGVDAYILTSPDGITWTERVNPINIQLNSVCWADTQFVAVGLASGVYAYIVASKTNTVITQIFPGVYGLFISSDFGLSMCNSAILTLGGNNIGSFDDATVEAVLCKSLWSQALDSLLRLHPWNCAITRAALLPDAVAPAYEWTSAFTLPTDLLRLLEVYGVTEYKVEGRKILCNEATLNIRYVFRNEDTSEWDSLLTEAMTAYMAFKLAYPLTKSNTTKDSQWQLFTNLLRTAKSIDTQEEPGDTVGDFPFIEVRRR